MLHEEVTCAPAGQAGKGMEGAQHSLCKGMRTPGKCRSLRGHKVSWKVRLRSDKKVLRWSVPKRLSLTYRFKNSLKCFHDGGVGRARRSGLHFRAMATVEKIPGRPTGAAQLRQDARFVMEVRCIRLQSEPLSFPLVFRLKHDLESPSHPVSTCLTHPLPTT